MKREYLAKVREQIEVAIVSGNPDDVATALRTVNAVRTISEAEQTMDGQEGKRTIRNVQLKVIATLLSEEDDVSLVNAHMIAYGLVLGL